MKKIKYIFSAVLLAGLTSCDPADFGDLNVDPNNPSAAITSSLLTNAERNLVGPITDTQGSLYTQQIANKQYTSADRYETIQWSFNGYYASPLISLQKIIELNTDAATKGNTAKYGSNNNQIAVARILKSYYFMHMTDRWGDLPYSDALKGKDSFKPKYDTQQAVYSGIFSELKAAAAQIDGGASVTGDILMNGDMAKWKKFANSLRLIAALRLSKVDPALGKAEFVAAMQSGVITSSADDVKYTFLNEDDNDNPWEDRFETRRDWTVSEGMVNTLKSFKDPRLAVYADVALLKQDYVGMPYGLDESQAGSISNGNVSFLGAALRKQDSPGYILTASQVHLAMAEAAVLGWISDSPETHYNAGVKAGLEMYGLGASTTAYLANPGVKFSSATAMQQIGTQRWITLFLNGYEAWAEWRRTGYPDLKAPTPNLNPGGAIPRRQGYTTTERDLNGTNYNEAVTRLGGVDDLNGRVWWDKK